MLEITKPFQKKSWNEKVANKKQFFKDNIEYFINISCFRNDIETSKRLKEMRMLYGIYNSEFPAAWFKTILDPRSTGDKKNKSWPAQIRPNNILRPNIDYLWGEYCKRPFENTVGVFGEDGYNDLLESKSKIIYKSVSQIAINTLNEELTKHGIDTGVESKEQDSPVKVEEKFMGTYKNNKAVQAQTDLDLIMEDQRVREKLLDGMKDWLCVGEVCSYRNVRRDDTIYERIDPMEFDGDKAPGLKNGQDGTWAVRRIIMDISDVVDRFYDTMKDEEVDGLLKGEYSQTPDSFYSYLQTTPLINTNKIPVYHVCWRSEEKFGVLTYPNPITGEMEEDIVDEDYPVDKSMGESIKWMWRTRWLEGYRVGKSLYLEMQPVKFAPSLMNNLAKSTGPYNYRRFSDTHSPNTSVLKLGLHFQGLHVITEFVLERTIAKSKGKIVLLDQNVIPKGPGWTDEKFFHFSEAQGWGLINRNQEGVDKSFNQYQVLDLGLFEHIKNLIEVMEYCKKQYDDLLGLSPQVKAQPGHADSATAIRSSIYQSSIITEMVYAGFEQFARTDIEAILDCSQISNINGKRAVWVSSEGRSQLLDIDPIHYCYSQLGLMTQDVQKENAVLTKLKEYGQAFAQNGATPSTILAMETATSVAKIKNLLLSVEKRQIEVEQQQAETEHEGEIAKIELQNKFQEFLNLLDIEKIHEEYNRKEDLVLIQGDINMALQEAQKEVQDDSVGATEALMKFSNESKKIDAENDRKNQELSSKLQTQKSKEKRELRMDEHKQKLNEKDMKIKEDKTKKEIEIKRMTAKASIKKKSK